MTNRDSYMPYIALVLFSVWMALEWWDWPRPAALKPTTWLDHEPAMTIGKGDPAAQRIQLGLRSDGVVVWRRGYEPLTPAP